MNLVKKGVGNTFPAERSRVHRPQGKSWKVGEAQGVEQVAEGGNEGPEVEQGQILRAWAPAGACLHAERSRKSH